jgi:Glyoxalase/Bleomycin resistance protein/Dioxygenase superfamily
MNWPASPDSVTPRAYPQSAFCAYLSLVALAELGISAICVHVRWADLIAALLVLPLVVWVVERSHAWKGLRLLLDSEEQMISGAHIVVYSKNAEADRAFFRDVLGFKSVDAGHGWLIFALPPGEAAVHPSDESGAHELYFMCDDLKVEMTSLEEKGR